MAFFDDFLKALAAGDNIRDYTHASRIFRDDGYNLAPKSQFLYYVAFEFDDAVRSNTDFYTDPSKTYTIGVLVKNIQLPSYQLNLVEKNQYGKHTYTQTRINYQPVEIVFHDDMANTINEFWVNYYRYYYADSNQDRAKALFEDSNKYIPDYDTNKYGYKGFDQSGNSVQPFLKAIKIYSLHQKQFTEYTLVKPMIESMAHGSHDSGSSQLMEHRMTLRYQSVLYGKGAIAKDNPAGFKLKYDNIPSPIANSTTSIFGTGGLVDTISGIITDIGNGDILSAGIKVLRGKEAFDDIDLGSIVKEEALETVGEIARKTTVELSNRETTVPISTENN